MIAQIGTFAERFDAVDVYGIVEVSCERSGSVGTAADTGADSIGKMSGHFKELLAGFFADAELEVAHHQREGVGTGGGTDAVDGIFIIFCVGFKSGIDRFFQSLLAVADRDDLGTEDLHAGNIGSLFGNVDFAHVDFTFQSEIGGGSCQCDTVLTGTGFSDDAFLPMYLASNPSPMQ